MIVFLFNNLVFMAIFTFIPLIFLYFFSLYDKEFKKIRSDLLNHVGKHVCDCKGECNHRDFFIHYMRTKGVNIICEKPENLRKDYGSDLLAKDDFPVKPKGWI